MKKIIILSLILFIGNIVFGQEQKTYEIPQLEKLAKLFKDDRIYYNLGILYGDAGNKGLAILNLRRANLLNPYSKDIKNQLNAYRDSIGIPPYLMDLSPLEQAVLFPFLILNINWTGFIGLLFLLTGSCGLSVILGRFTIILLENHQKQVMIFSLIFFILGIIFILSAIVRYNVTFDNKNAVLINDSILQERPEENSIKINDAAAGLECVIKKASSDYYLINTIDGHEGWINKTNLTRIWEGLL